MEKIKIGNSNLEASRIAFGCMSLGGGWNKNPISLQDEYKAFAAIDCALENGINFFDHADIYCLGKSEEVFSKILDKRPKLRENLILQSKCGINNLGKTPYYDFSKDYILSSVDGILKRLKTEYLDVLLLHRPDSLVEPEEVAEAFDILKTSGKVRHFGVSNHNAMQIRLLNKYLNEPLIVNQLEISLANSSIIDEGLNVNSNTNPGPMRNFGTLEYCRLHDITLQAWSPLAGGRIVDPKIEKYRKLNITLDEYAKKYGVKKGAIVVNWLLRHPAKIQPIIGTRSIQRIKHICQSSQIKISREEWYNLYNLVEHRKLL